MNRQTSANSPYQLMLKCALQEINKDSAMPQQSPENKDFGSIWVVVSVISPDPKVCTTYSRNVLCVTQ